MYEGVNAFNLVWRIALPFYLLSCKWPLIRYWRPSWTAVIGQRHYRACETTDKNDVWWPSVRSYRSTSMERSSQRTDVRWHSWRRNTLDCDQSSRIVFSRIGLPIEFGPTRNSDIRSINPENPTLEPNTEWIGWSVVEIWILQDERSVGRRSSVVSRRSVLNIYFFFHWSHILLFATLGT